MRIIFGVICGEYMFKESHLNMLDFVKQAYMDYFGMPKEIIPTILCWMICQVFVLMGK